MWRQREEVARRCSNCQTQIRRVLHALMCSANSCCKRCGRFGGKKPWSCLSRQQEEEERERFEEARASDKTWKVSVSSAVEEQRRADQKLQEDCR